MKKSIAVLLVMVVALVSVFAAGTSTLNLSTEITGVTKAGIVVAGAVPAAFPESVLGEEAQALTSAPVSYAFVVETNQALATTTVVAGPVADGANYIGYTLAAGGATSKATNADGASVTLLEANANTGKRVVGAVFTLAVDADADKTDKVFDLATAPAGTYSGVVTITYTAN